MVLICRVFIISFLKTLVYGASCYIMNANFIETKRGGKEKGTEDSGREKERERIYILI